MSKIEIKVPALGESITEATVSKWIKQEGDNIKKDEAILELETDKVTQEIYAASSGVLEKIFFKEGEDVKIGDILADIGVNDSKVESTKHEKFLKSKDLEEKEVNIKVPSLGESITEAVISKWLKKEEMVVKKGEPIVEIETDKVTQELYAEQSGFIKSIISDEKQEVKIGQIIGIIKVQDIEKKLDKKEAPALSEIKDKVVEMNELNTDAEDMDPTNVKRSGKGNTINVNDLIEFAGETSFTPSARRYLNENQVDYSALISRDSKSSRLTKEGIEKTLGKSRLDYEVGDNRDFNENTDKAKPLSKLRQSIAKNLKNAQNTAAMLTTFNEIDMNSIIKIRKKYKESFFKKYNTKLGFMSFFAKASIVGLKEIPEINAEIKESSIIYKNRYDISIAVGTDKGLFVPVVRNADKLSFAEIEIQILKYGNLARENKITAEDMRNGTFTISNGGVYGSMLSTPILNTPQSGILGLHNIVKRPVVLNDEIVIRPIMYVALTYDHRIVDGRQAVTFLVRLKQLIENPEELLFN